MYEGLVSALRNCGFPNSYRYCPNCVFVGKYGGSCDLKKLLPEAADAIESTSKAYQMMAEAYESEVTKHYWIPVTERLPEEYETVLFLSMSGDVISGYYDSEHKSYCDMTGFRYLCTHWMPLPEPPKEES